MDFVNILLFIILPLLGALYLFLKKKFSYFEEKGIPHIKPSSWFLGNLTGVGKTIHFVEFIKQVYEESKKKGDVIGGFYSMFTPTLIVNDLELIKQITIKDFNNFQDRGVYVNEEDEPLTGHLFSIGGEKWRFLRNKLSPVFTSGKIKLMYNAISDKGEIFVKAIEKASSSGSVNVKEISNRFTLDVMSSCAFGMESNTLEGENLELIKMARKIFRVDGFSIIRTFVVSTFPKISKLLKLRMFEKSVSDYFYDVISESIKHREINDVKRNDFLNMLVQLKNKGSIDGEISKETRKLTMDECVAQGFVFFLGGAETSSTVISWAIIELGHHPEIQEKLRTEIFKITRETDGEITYDNLHEMTYLNQVINGKLESLIFELDKIEF